MKKKAIIVVITVVLLLVSLGLLNENPIISNKANAPANYLDAIADQSDGLYSDILPLVPVYVSVENFTSDRVYYTIHYFPFGNVGMSYSESDGYNMEKPLTNH